jgi:hypothetical protein
MHNAVNTTDHIEKQEGWGAGHSCRLVAEQAKHAPAAGFSSLQILQLRHHRQASTLILELHNSLKQK